MSELNQRRIRTSPKEKSNAAFLLWPFEAKRVTATILGERRERSTPKPPGDPFEAQQ